MFIAEPPTPTDLEEDEKDIPTVVGEGGLRQDQITEMPVRPDLLDSVHPNNNSSGEWRDSLYTGSIRYGVFHPDKGCASGILHLSGLQNQLSRF